MTQVVDIEKNVRIDVMPKVNSWNSEARQDVVASAMSEAGRMVDLGHARNGTGDRGLCSTKDVLDG